MRIKKKELPSLNMFQRFVVLSVEPAWFFIIISRIRFKGKLKHTVSENYRHIHNYEECHFLKLAWRRKGACTSKKNYQPMAGRVTSHGNMEYKETDSKPVPCNFKFKTWFILLVHWPINSFFWQPLSLTFPPIFLRKSRNLYTNLSAFSSKRILPCKVVLWKRSTM